MSIIILSFFFCWINITPKKAQQESTRCFFCYVGWTRSTCDSPFSGFPFHANFIFSWAWVDCPSHSRGPSIHRKPNDIITTVPLFHFQIRGKLKAYTEIETPIWILSSNKQILLTISLTVCSSVCVWSEEHGRRIAGVAETIRVRTTSEV